MPSVRGHHDEITTLQTSSIDPARDRKFAFSPEPDTEALGPAVRWGKQRPHIANSRMQIAPTARVSVAARDSVYFQSHRAMAQEWTLVVATELIWIKHGVGGRRMAVGGWPSSIDREGPP